MTSRLETQDKLDDNVYAISGHKLESFAQIDFGDQWSHLWEPMLAQIAPVCFMRPEEGKIVWALSMYKIVRTCAVTYYAGDERRLPKVQAPGKLRHRPPPAALAATKGQKKKK